ncbi:diaminopimelate epimerase [Phycisphaerales bacterium]|nr:diaminopimelate epimerase [Phycisphaerales bacterium]
MPAIPFFKYHGLGNDFILLDSLAHPQLANLPWPSLARRLCDRHSGIGADGLLLLAPTPAADLRMSIFNPDGSDGGMCGNGIRCAARHVIERHARSAQPLHVQVANSSLRVTAVSQPGAFHATVEMGEPTHGPPDVSEALPADLAAACERAAPSWAASCGLTPAFIRVSMPNPHAVLYCCDVARVPIALVGPPIESHPIFPNRTNVQFVQVLDRGHARVRTWERGAGATLACGTGACAVLVAGVLTDRLAREATIHLPGGDLLVRWDQATNHVLMTGPAEYVFDGSIAL